MVCHTSHHLLCKLTSHQTQHTHTHTHTVMTSSTIEEPWVVYAARVEGELESHAAKHADYDHAIEKALVQYLDSGRTSFETYNKREYELNVQRFEYSTERDRDTAMKMSSELWAWCEDMDHHLDSFMFFYTAEQIEKQRGELLRPRAPSRWS
jgi:hypothetical protein